MEQLIRKQYKEEFMLSAETIDSVSEMLAASLKEAGTDQKDVLRIRLSLEEILGIWLKKLGGRMVSYRSVQRFGRLSIEVCVDGEQISTEEDEEDEGFLLSNRLLAQAGLALVYTYKNGKNCLSCNPQKKFSMGQMAQLMTAVVLAVVLGLAAGFLPQEGKTAALAVTQPLFHVIFGGLRAVSSPLVFFAVCCGIVSIGDLSVVGRIGKKLIVRMIAGTFLLGVVMAIVSCLLFPTVTETGNAVSGNFSEIYQMILDIVPSDIVSPFLNGNALQIVFLGICVGTALLILGERTAAVQNFVMQTNEVIRFLMSALGRLVPLFVFLSLFDLLLSDVGSGFFSLLKVFIIAIPGCFLLTLFYVFVAATRLSVSPVLLIRKMLPTYLIAMMTASSAAALTTNLETCEKELGIPKKVADFAIPLGQVLYKPGFVVGLFGVALSMAESYGVSITPQFLVMAVLTMGLLAMATPPIPGGSLSVFTVMFAQLGIPAGAVALAVAANAILDFFMTAAGLACLQVQVMLAAKSVGMLDQDRLRSQISDCSMSKR